MTNRVSLEEALNTVAGLDEIISPDYQPCIEAINGTVVYQVNLDTNFSDSKAYITGVSKYIEEAQRHAKFNTLLEKGNEHAIMLYTWRCCSRAIPQVKSNDQANRIDIYEKTVEVLQPHVDKLMDMMKFQEEAIMEFCNEMRCLCHPKQEKDFVSEAFLLTIGKFINMFAILDELKNMKSSVKNDHSAYRRIAQFRKSEANKCSLESQNLSIFLATNDIIRTNLKKALDNPDQKIGVEGYEEILADVVNTSVQMLENNMFLLPQEKHVLVKVIGFSLSLMDSDKTSINKLDAKKRINLSKIDKIFKQHKVVPLYGDMQITPFNYIMKTKNYDESKWPLCSNSNTDSQQGRILEQIDRIRNEHMSYISELARYSNDIAISKESKRNDEECRHLYDLALNGLKLLSKWTNTVLELYNWKLLHLADPKSCPKDVEDYERATKYNYNSAEKFAIVEIIAMIKGLQTLMCRLENLFKEAINQTTYCQLQHFVQIELRDCIRKAISKKKDVIKTILSAVRVTCADWYRGREPDDDPALKGKKDTDSTSFKIERPSRCIGPSSTQLYMVRTMLESLISDRGGKNRKSLRKELDLQHVDEIDKFHADSFFWPYLLNFSDTLQKCCDLSQMWYREFFLEMTMGKKIQFPIEMSMPWILTNHILESKDLSMIEYVFYPLDLYNDAAMNALTIFKKRYLYDECEAEVNLCFDQFVYKLSEQIFRAYKQVAAGMLLDKKFRDDFNKIQTSAAAHMASGSSANSTASHSHNSTTLQQMQQSQLLLQQQQQQQQPYFNNNSQQHHHAHRIHIPNVSRYEILMKQRHLQLLGRSINLSRLIAQRIVIMLKNNLKTCISKFESSSLTAIIELDTLVKLIKLTHKLLSKHLVLDDFDALLKEADFNVSSSYGRITIHILYELTADVLPNYCYNTSTNRFVVTRIHLNREAQRDEPPMYQPQDLWGSKAIQIAYQAIHSLYTDFIGQQHFKCINKYLGYQGIALVINEFLQFIQSAIQTSLVDHLNIVNKLIIRKNVNLPRIDYGSPGILTFYYESLVNLMKHRELQTTVFSLISQIGNAIILSLQIEQALALDEVSDLTHSSMFLNWFPKPFCKDNENYEAKLKKNEQRFASLQIVKTIEQLGSEKQVNLAREGELLTRERLRCGLSIFEFVLTKIQSFLTDKIWSHVSPQYSSLNSIVSNEDNCEFHRLWSAIQFIYCLPKQGNGVNSVEEVYGDALIWSGCTFISLLNQQQRFEVFDHCYHLLKVNQIDGKTDVINNISLENFISRIRKHQILNQEIFSILNKYLKSIEFENSASKKEDVYIYHPPLDYKLNA